MAAEDSMVNRSGPAAEGAAAVAFTNDDALSLTVFDEDRNAVICSKAVAALRADPEAALGDAAAVGCPPERCRFGSERAVQASGCSPTCSASLIPETTA